MLSATWFKRKLFFTSFSVITVTILDDTVPEDEKTVVVHLTNTVGGANVVNGTATIIILPNDNIAGVLALDKTSVLANEGKKR